MGKMMKKNKREKRKSKFNAPIVVLVFTILLILFFVMAYMLFHSRSIASLEAEKSVVVERNKESINDYNKTLKDDFIIRANSVSYIIENNEEYEGDTEKLKELSNALMVNEIHLFTPSGVIYSGTNPEYYGFSLFSGQQMSFFIPLLSDTKLSLCQAITPHKAEGKLMMYAMV